MVLLRGGTQLHLAFLRDSILAVLVLDPDERLFSGSAPRLCMALFLLRLLHGGSLLQSVPKPSGHQLADSRSRGVRRYLHYVLLLLSQLLPLRLTVMTAVLRKVLLGLACAFSLGSPFPASLPGLHHVGKRGSLISRMKVLQAAFTVAATSEAPGLSPSATSFFRFLLDYSADNHTLLISSSAFLPPCLDGMELGLRKCQP